MFQLLENLKNCFIPTVSTEYVIRKNLSFWGASCSGKWIYYWDGDHEIGHVVKVLAEDQIAYLKRGRM